MLTLKIAFRNLFRHKRRTVLTALSMIVGFVLGVFFIAWADGSYHLIIDTFTRNRMGHIQIHKKGYLDKPSLYKNIENIGAIKNIIEQTDGIDAWAPRLYAAGLVSAKDKSAAAMITGIDPVRESAATKIEMNIIKGAYLSAIPSHEAIIGKGLAEILKADIKDDIVIVSQAADGSIANDVYIIKGIIDIGDDISNRSAFYMHLEDAQELFVLPGKVHEIAIICHKLNDVNKITALLTASIHDPTLSVESWQEFANSFYRAMKADMQGLWISVFVVALVIAIGVLNTVLMSVLERRREYGVLKALGTRPRQIFNYVLLEISILTLLSIIIGIGLGLIVVWLIVNYGITLSEPLTWGGMQFTTMRGEFNLRSFYIPGLVVLFSAIIVSIFPAFRAAKTEPAKTMRMF